MGGRGAFIEGTNNFVSGGQKYHTVEKISVGNRIMKVIEPIGGGNLKTPTLSHSPNSIYATVKKNGELKQITVYDSNREKLYDIDLDHDHTGGLFPDGHVQYYVDGEREQTYSALTSEQRKLVNALKKGRKR